MRYETRDRGRDAIRERRRAREKKVHPVFFNTTQRPGHVVNCPQSEEGREQRESNTYILYLWGLYMIYIGTDT